MQSNRPDPLSSAAMASGALGQLPSVSEVLASLSQRQVGASRLLQETALLNAVAAPQTDLVASLANSLTGNSRSVVDELAAASQDIAVARASQDLSAGTDPLLLASAVAARRQLEIARAAQRDALMSEAYKRGREEALLSLVRLSAFDEIRQADASQQAASLLRGSPNQEPAQTTTPVGAAAKPDRRKQNTPYFDASALKDPDPILLASRRARGGVTEPFPEKLHRLLREVEKSGETDIISFFPHGRAFAVHNPTRFVSEVMPKYFRQSRLSSFQRQLNLYGFTRITQGPDSGGYYHELFLKGRPNLCVHMRRVGVPQGNANKATNKPPTNEPDFYSMNPISGTAENGEGKTTGLSGR